MEKYTFVKKLERAGEKGRRKRAAKLMSINDRSPVVISGTWYIFEILLFWPPANEAFII